MKKFARVQLIASDVDGTLENSVDSVYNSIERQLRSLRRGPSALQLMIATGRTLTGIKRILASLQIDHGIPAIVYNGSLVADSSTWEPKRHRTIDIRFLSDLLKAIDLSSYAVTAYFFEYHDLNFQLGSFGPSEVVYGWSEKPLPTVEVNGLHVKWNVATPISLESNGPTAILVQSHLDGFSPEVIQFIESDDRVSLTKSGSRYLEVRPVDSNKGVALCFAAGLLNCDQENTVALGDNDNDAEMLKWAGIGIAVRGASSKAIEAADFVCNHGVAKGVVEVMRLISHSRRYYLEG